MAITNLFGWRVYVGGVGASNNVDPTGVPSDASDITSRVLGFECRFSIGFGVLGTASAVVELDNSDGYFTPTNTPYDASNVLYDDPVIAYNAVRFDWFGEPLFIMPLDDTTYPVLPGDPTPRYEGETRPCFSGVVTNVEVQDDGFTSRITITADDVFTFLSRYSLPADVVGANRLPQIIESLFAIQANTYAVLPKFGADQYLQTVSVASLPYYFQLQSIDWPEGAFLGDLLAAHVAVEHGLVFPPRITFSKTMGVSYVTFGLDPTHGDVYPRERLWRDSADPISKDPEIITFVSTDGVVKQEDYPFRYLRVGSHFDNLTGTSVASRAGGSTTAISTNATSTATYGARASQFFDMPFETDGDAAVFTDSITQWFDTAEYTVDGLEVTGGMLQAWKDTAPAGAFTYNFKWPNEMLWRTMKVVANGAGGAAIDLEVSFFDAELSVTAEDWMVRFNGGRTWNQAFGFILNDTDFGVLDENRI